MIHLVTMSPDRTSESISDQSFLMYLIHTRYVRNEESMKEFASAFYHSPEWEHCREAYLRSRGYLCEQCLQKGIVTPAKIVHHKIFLTPENINEPRITLDWNNLFAVCKNCHEEIHENCGRKNKRRYEVDEMGRVKIKG